MMLLEFLVFTAASGGGRETERGCQATQVRGRDLPQSRQAVLEVESETDGPHGGLAAKEELGEQANERREDRLYSLHAASSPADRARQPDRVAAHPIGGRLQALSLLDFGNHLLELKE